MGMYNGIASLKNNVAVPEVVKQSYHMSQQFPQRNKSIYAHENLYMDGHSGIIHNRPKVETGSIQPRLDLLNTLKFNWQGKSKREYWFSE